MAVTIATETPTPTAYTETLKNKLMKNIIFALKHLSIIFLIAIVSYSATSQETAQAVINGENHTLQVFTNGDKTYTTTAEIPNGEALVTSFTYKGTQYINSPLSIQVNNAQVKQITIQQTTTPMEPGNGKNLVLENLDFGYHYFEFEEENTTFEIPFFGIIGVETDSLPYYNGSKYEYQPNGLQTQMKAIYRVHYIHNGNHLATYGVLDYVNGVAVITYIDNPSEIDTNIFQVQHLRYLPGPGIVSVVSRDYWITLIDQQPITGINGAVNFSIVPDSAWSETDYIFKY